MEGILERGHGPDTSPLTPVPQSERVLRAVDVAILWGDLGIGLLVLVTGALLVPALSFGAAVIAVISGSIVGCLLLAAAASAGAREGVPTMVLFRPILGVRASYVPSVLNALQLVGWTAVEFWAMSLVADLVSRRAFGFSARPLWLAITALLCTGLALWGPIGVVRVWMKRFGAWIITAICAAVTVVVLLRGDLAGVLEHRGTGGFPTFGAALDLVIAMPISWLPLVADYTRFAIRPRAAFVGTFAGYLVANVWLYSLGALLVLSEGAAPDPAGIATAILALAGGSLAGVLGLVALLVGETDEAFADIYSGAVSLQNIWPRASGRSLALGIAGVAVLLAAWLDMARYEAFLFLLGSVFVPLFGILIAKVYVAKRNRRTRAAFAWIVGFIAYHWIQPTGPAWWIEGVGLLPGSPLAASAPWLPASLLSFGAAFTLALDYPAGDREPRGER